MITMLPMPSVSRLRRKSCPATGDIIALQAALNPTEKPPEKTGSQTPEFPKKQFMDIPGLKVEDTGDLLSCDFKPNVSRSRSKSTSMLFSDQQELLKQLGKEPERRLSSKLKSIEDDIKKLFKSKKGLFQSSDSKESKRKTSGCDSRKTSLLSNDITFPITTLQCRTDDLSIPAMIYIYTPSLYRKLTALEEFMQLQMDLLVEDYISEAAPALEVISLQDGSFKASIQMVNFPTGGNILIRVSGYTLEFYWCTNIDNNIKRNSELFNVSTGMVYCKSVDLPMYVDMNQLNFKISETNRILLSASTKEFLGLPLKETTTGESPAIPIVNVNPATPKVLSVSLCLNPCTA